MLRALTSKGVPARLLLVLGCASIAALSGRKGDWEPVWFFGALAGAGIASDFFVVSLAPNLTVSAALVPVVVAGIFLGPLPAVVVGVSSRICDGLRRGIGLRRVLGNTLSYGSIGLAVALAGRP